MSSGAGHEIPPGKSYWEFKAPRRPLRTGTKSPSSAKFCICTKTATKCTLRSRIVQVSCDVFFDFGWQDPTLNQPFQIKPGDELTTRCYYNNKKSTNVKFGLGSDEEMCIDFIFYYPYITGNANLGATQYCGVFTGGN